MTHLILVSWRDIPAQLIGGSGRRNQKKRILHARFEKAIDRAAMRSNAQDTDSYLAEWRKSAPVPVAKESLPEAMELICMRIESEYDTARLSRLIEDGGHDKTREADFAQFIQTCLSQACLSQARPSAESSRIGGS